MKLILHVFLYCVFCGVSGIQYIAQVYIAFLNTALNVWQSSCPCLLKAGITDVNRMADIHFKQEFSRFFLAILFQSPLPTPPSFSTIIRATDVGWLDYAVPAFAVLLIGNCIESFSFSLLNTGLNSLLAWTLRSLGGHRKERHGTCNLFHLSWGPSACVLMDPWSIKSGIENKATWWSITLS